MTLFQSHFKLFFIAGLFIIMSACKSSKPSFNPENTDKDYITFGNGGGITGQSKKYFFTDDGHIYFQEGDSLKLITKVPEKTCKQIFSSYTKQGFDKSILNEPGNRYYFLELKSKDLNHAMKWGRNALQNPKIEIFYNNLMNIIKKNSENKK